METYRKKLKVQTVFSLVGILVAVAVVALINYIPQPGIVLPNLSASQLDSFRQGFVGGVAAAFAMLLLLNICKNIRALRNEAKLKAQYIEAHDERKQRIWELSGANAYWFDTFGLLLAAIVAGYFSTLAFLCIVGCLWYICVVRLILKIYYNRKY